MATISTLARTDPATVVPSKFKSTYLNIRWLARMEAGADSSILVFKVIFLFLKSFSVTPCTCSKMSQTLKLVAACVNVPSLML